MNPAAPLVLVVNPGAGSTKLGLFRGEALVAEEALRHPPEVLASPRMVDQLPMRLEAARAFLARVAPGERLDATVGRGGLLGPVPAGTLRATPEMAEELLRAPRGEHASNLGVPIALALAGEQGCPAFTVDPVSVDELLPEARPTGLAGVERRSFAHALNIRAVARRHARTEGRPLETLRLVVAHLGTGVSLAALREERMVDVVNPQDEGPFAGDRAGGVPVTAVVDLCFAPGAERGAVRRRLFGDGGLYSLLGTRDAREAVARAAAGTPPRCWCWRPWPTRWPSRSGPWRWRSKGRSTPCCSPAAWPGRRGWSSPSDAGSPGSRRWWCCPARTSSGRWREGCCGCSPARRRRATTRRPRPDDEVYTRPWETMAFATLMKPAMLAPTT